jgi:hypothetical protein
MRNSFLILVTALVLTSCASKTSFNSFYSENRTVSDFSLSTSAFFGNLFIPKEDLGEYKDLFRKVKHYNIMVFSENSIVLDKRFDSFIKRKKYTSIFRINQKGEKVQLYFLQQKNVIKEIVLKIKSENDFVFLGLKTNILESDFNKIMEGSDINITSN